MRVRERTSVHMPWPTLFHISRRAVRSPLPLSSFPRVAFRLPLTVPVVWSASSAHGSTSTSTSTSPSRRRAAFSSQTPPRPWSRPNFPLTKAGVFSVASSGPAAICTIRRPPAIRRRPFFAAPCICTCTHPHTNTHTHTAPCPFCPDSRPTLVRLANAHQGLPGQSHLGAVRYPGRTLTTKRLTLVGELDRRRNVGRQRGKTAVTPEVSIHTERPHPLLDAPFSTTKPSQVSIQGAAEQVTPLQQTAPALSALLARLPFLTHIRGDIRTPHIHPKPHPHTRTHNTTHHAS